MTHDLLIYIMSVLTIALCPGPDMIYIISQSIAKGRRFAVFAVLGIGTGCFVHILAVTLGLSSFIFKSPSAFMAIKYLGAAYLFYLGFSSLFQKQSSLLDTVNLPQATSWTTSFKQGFLTNVLNPKVALFFMAFLPQFVEQPSPYSIELQMLLLGLLFNAIGTSVNMLMALFFSKMKNWLSTRPILLIYQEKITGCVLIGLGCRLVVL